MNLLQYVNPLQGTASTYEYSNGNTLPLVARPFGMAAWSAQTQEAGGGWFFHPSHRRFEGIRLTHQPSPWIGDYGHLTLLPQTGPLAIAAAQRSSSFRPEEMLVQPDYFRIRLRRYETLLELTPTERCASIRMTFGRGEAGRVIIAPFAGESSFQIDTSGGRMTGYTRANSGGVPSNYAMYFVLEWDCDTDAEGSGLFDQYFEPSPDLSGTGERFGAYIGLRPPESGQVNLRIGTSFISIEQAEVNLAREIGTSSFDEVRVEAAGVWNGMLNRIQVEDRNEERIRTFYTCMYRVCLFPRVWHEFTAGEEMVHYSPYNGKVTAGPMYCDNGFWDTFRTSYPLFSLLFPSRLGEILESYVNAYKEGGWMPKWSSPGERSAMPGTLIDAVFADAYVKGIEGFDVEAAYEGLLKHALQAAEDPQLGRKGYAAYEQYGYLPADQFHESVSNTLDYVYGDFCIAQLAQGLGKEEQYKLFISRAANYTKLLDPSTGFMRAKKADGSWAEGFDPVEWGGAYCEGSAWQCSWAVPHDVMGLAQAMGGKDALLARLDELMTAKPVFRVGSYGFEIHEMSEMAAVDFGQCAISNQPSFHIPYLFTALGYPERTRYWTSRLARELFSAAEDGLPGDEDNGSLCAWYIFTSLGMYPLCPGVPEYVIGRPLYDRITVQLESGKQIMIEAEGDSAENQPADPDTVSLISLNGQPHHSLFFSHNQLTAGALIQHKLSDTPDHHASDAKKLPYSLSFQR
ncbi:GH92 family glycosyl hydrolase [Paenibacillus sp. MMS20-IR301]|uniref:GH92 family glycosyl hydrolase n=1 Tax=Paenibacillus sp. MMS20-IR301 TaxID=2895946 RepID=UPI0028E8C430|nr:GH92 family glycosyl hydrolase [Paenibacillus sp. MMS20-IR301]WNS45151.1 GH92 family glycosyl hydrolase [Paenibacillus sp. MMS20-IR301]